MSKPIMLISAPVATRSGYGNHSRDLIESLIEMDKWDIKIASLRWGDCSMDALDDNNPEDINTHVEDHAYDALRYGCMSRPMHTSYANRFNKTPRPQFQPVDRMFGY